MLLGSYSRITLKLSQQVGVGELGESKKKYIYNKIIKMYDKYYEIKYMNSN